MLRYTARVLHGAPVLIGLLIGAYNPMRMCPIHVFRRFHVVKTLNAGLSHNLSDGWLTVIAETCTSPFSPPSSALRAPCSSRKRPIYRPPLPVRPHPPPPVRPPTCPPTRLTARPTARRPPVTVPPGIVYRPSACRYRARAMQQRQRHRARCSLYGLFSTQESRAGALLPGVGRRRRRAG